MKVLFVQETDWLKRYPAQQHHLAEMMSLRGHEVRVIDYELLWKSQRERGFWSGRRVFNSIAKIHMGARVNVIRPAFIRLPWLDYISILFSHWKEIRRQLKEFRPDAIVGFGILNSYTASLAVRGSKVPFVYYWIDVLHLLIPTKWFRGFGKWVESAALKRADQVLAINEKLKETLLKMGAPVGRTQVLRTGIDTKQFNQKLSGANIRQQFNLRPNDIVLFFMGWLYPFSGLKEVILQLARRRHANLKLLIVGDGDAYVELNRIRDSHNLQDTVVFAGRKPYAEIPDFIAAADICLLPSYSSEPIMREIVPIKLYEYMAMRKPVIATRLPGVISEFGENNGIVYVESPNDAVDKSVELALGGSLGLLGDLARNFVERNSWDKVTDEFEKILLQAIERREK